MKKLKLEVGKTYRNRKGTELVKIIRKVSSKPFSYIGNDGCYYTENGKWIYGCNEDPEDLIEEVPETRHTFDIPDGVKKITLDYFGNRIVVEMVPGVDAAERCRIMDYLQGYANNVTWNHEQLCWLIEGYLKHKEDKK